MTRISILSDIHVAESPAQSLGVDTQANFARAISRLRARRPDYLVLLGDYSIKEPRRAHAEWVATRARLVGAPVLALAGNHDHGPDVAEAFELASAPATSQLYYRRDFGTHRALFLDTSAGYIDSDQLDWLHMEIRGSREPTIVFMHHPPTAMGVPFMDARYAFRDEGGEVFNLLFGGVTPVHVFCGHYHVARTVQIGMHSLHLCPSTYFQLDPTEEEFVVSSVLPAIRHVEFVGDQLRTWVEVLPPTTSYPGAISES